MRAGIACLVALTCWPAFLAAQAISEDPLAVQLTLAADANDAELTPTTSLRTARLDEGESHYEPIEVDVGACYSFYALAEDIDADLDLHLYGDTVRVAADVDTNREPDIHWCNPGLSRVSLELRMYSGSGRVVFQAFRAGEPSQPDTLWAHLSAMAGRYAEGYVPAAPPEQAELATGGEARFNLMLAGDRCYVIVGTGVDTVTDLDFFLTDSAGVVVDSDQATHAEPVLRYCVDAGQGGAFELRIVMLSGFGQVGFRVLGN